MLEFCTADGVCGWAFWGHVLDRFAIHVASSTFALLGLMAIWYELAIRRILPQGRGIVLALVPACVVMLAVAFREPLDTEAGNAAVKSLIDIVSWLLGLGLAFVGLARYAPRWGRWAINVRRAFCGWPRLQRILTPRRSDGVAPERDR